MVPLGVLKSLLVPLPVVGMPFERISMDLVGPLERSTMGFRYILVVMDYATHFPEAVPLKSATAHTIAAELLKNFTRVSLPREILTNQGANFTSRLLHEVCGLLEIKELQSSVYHRQMDRLAEQFNSTWEGMLRKSPQRNCTTGTSCSHLCYSPSGR